MGLSLAPQTGEVTYVTSKMCSESAGCLHVGGRRWKAACWALHWQCCVLLYFWEGYSCCNI
jgi:hypothetical protein